MGQTPLFDDAQYNRIKHDHVVNVASVPQLSPFRYPGGKTWLVPYIHRWLSPLLREQYHLAPIRAAEFVEPFAGGGIISLTVAAENLSERVTMVEIDEVRSLAHRHHFDVQAIAMKSTHHARMQELLIGKDLNWLR